MFMRLCVIHAGFCLCFSREGRNQYEKAFGVDAQDLFQALYRFVENTLIYIPSVLVFFLLQVKPVCQSLLFLLKKQTPEIY